jgi:hypothetical protein
MTPVRFSSAFSLLIKEKRQREANIYQGPEKHSVVTSVDKGGNIRGRNFNKDS